MSGTCTQGILTYLIPPGGKRYLPFKRYGPDLTYTILPTSQTLMWTAQPYRTGPPLPSLNQSSVSASLSSA